MTRSTTAAAVVALPRVTRRGASLQTRGITRRFAGANIYWLGLNDNYRIDGVPTAPSLGTVEAAFDAALAMHSSIVRVHTAGVSFGNVGGWSPAPPTLISSYRDGRWVYNEAAWKHLDQVIAAAGRRGLYLAVPFTDRQNFYHGGAVTIARMVLGSSATLGDFYTDPRVIGAFDSYLKHWFNRVNSVNGFAYKDDTTIAVAETGNELYDAPRVWTSGRAAAIKAAAPHVLVADGTAATGMHVTAANVAMSDVNVDIVGGHFYGRDRSWLTTDADAANKAGKVYWVGEYAWADKALPGGSWSNDGTRAQWLALLNQPGNHVDMVTMWSLLPSGRSDVGTHEDGAQLYYPSTSQTGAVEMKAGFSDISASNAAINTARSTEFVTRQGRLLSKSGSTFALYGASVYGQIDTAAKRTAEIALARAAKLNTIRILNWLDEKSARPDVDAFDPTRWSQVDAMIGAAQQAGLSVILDLSTYRNMLADGSSRNPYAASQLARWDAFVDWVMARVNTASGATYGTDSTIAYVAIAGEPSAPNSGDANKPTTAELTHFYAHVAARIKSRSAVLTCPGGFLFIDWDSGIDYAAIGADSNTDMLALHPYGVSDRKISVPLLEAWSETSNKPWIYEEFGQDAAAHADSVRSTYFEQAYSQALTYGAAGIAFWNVGPATSGSTYDVNSFATDTWSTVQLNSPLQ